MSESPPNGLFQLAVVAGAFGLGRATAPDRTPRNRLERDGVAYLASVIREWRPVNCHSEADCQLALENYLLGRFSEDRLLVESQYGAGPSRVDIVVERRFGIEIKYSLHAENEVKRVLGQAQDLVRSLVGSVLVLCGPTDEGLINRLLRDLRQVDEDERVILDVVHVPILEPMPRQRVVSSGVASEAHHVAE
jgi:hypothetical protein